MSETSSVASPGRWLWVALASLLVFAAVTWPFIANLNDLWTVRRLASIPGETAFMTEVDAFTSADHMQNIYIDSVVIENVLNLREPYLDLREGAAGPEPLRTTSMNLPWTPVIALLWPLFGLVTAYNLTLLLSTVVTALAAFGLLGRHTRWWLLAAAGALLYAFSTHRMYQLTVHFNAVMTWAFPVAVWAWEVMLERFYARGRWGRPAAVLAAVVLVVGVSGEYHLILYLAGLVSFLTVWELVRAWLGGRQAASRSSVPVGHRLETARGRPGADSRRGAPQGPAAQRSGAVGVEEVTDHRPHDRQEGSRRLVPWAPVAAAMGSVALACAYVLIIFGYVFQGAVAGDNGSWEQVVLYAPDAMALFRKHFGESGEGMIYVGAVVLVLATAGLVVTVTRRLGNVLPYVVLLFPLLLLTYGPTLKIAGVRPYRWAFDHIPFLSLQRVPERIMILTGLVLVLLVVVGVDRLVRMDTLGQRRLAVGVLVLVVAAVLVDYQVSRNVITPSYTGNAVVERLAAAGDEAGPIAGLPVVAKTTTWNAGTTYVAALSRRSALNAYNQTPAPWLDERLAKLAPLNKGEVTEAALQVLRETGTKQVLVIDEPRVLHAGGWNKVINGLERSGYFSVVEVDEPFALLEFEG